MKIGTILIFHSECVDSMGTLSRKPNCAIKKAIEAAQVAEEWRENYLKLQKEIAYAGVNSR